MNSDWIVWIMLEHYGDTSWPQHPQPLSKDALVFFTGNVVQHTGGIHDVKTPIRKWRLTSMYGNILCFPSKAACSDAQAFKRNVNANEITFREMLAKIRYRVSHSCTEIEDPRTPQTISCRYRCRILDFVFMEELWSFAGGPDI